ncbi:hypothetical protein ACFS7Z_13770 [Pontibacter toksunensis]|uniref:Uncharacterized protein n=1 Tax=Pontibacter toksunensis TaxID=1332631 RepID=A0ABW6BVV7_9BACT
MALITEVVQGTNFPASIGLTPDQKSKGVALTQGNQIQGSPKFYATLTDLQACPTGWLMPGNEGTVYNDAIAANNGLYTVSADLLTWTKYDGGGKVDSVNSVGPTAGTKNVALTTDHIPEGASLFFTNARAIGAVLTGYAKATLASAIAATDSILAAFGKLEFKMDLKADKTYVDGSLSTKADLVSGKVPTTQLPDSILGQLEYKGTYDAATNAPALPDATTVKGHYYVVSVAGTSIVNNKAYDVGDWAVSDGVVWDKVDNTDQVTLVFGRKGAITAQAGDYNSDQITEAANNKYFTNARAIAAVLTGYAKATISSALAATDSIAAAFGKLEFRIDEFVTALSNKQDKLTFDSAPTANSSNPVSSGGLFTAARAMAHEELAVIGVVGTDTELAVDWDCKNRKDDNKKLTITNTATATNLNVNFLNMDDGSTALMVFFKNGGGDITIKPSVNLPLGSRFLVPDGATKITITGTNTLIISVHRKANDYFFNLSGGFTAAA